MPFVLSEFYNKPGFLLFLFGMPPAVEIKTSNIHTSWQIISRPLVAM
jgi:hypothetical protein